MNSTIEISAIRDGDEKAFVGMYHQLNGKVYNFFLKRTREPEIAQDLTQQSFIRIYHYRSSLSLAHPLEKQVYIIARSVLINHLRQEGRKKTRELNYAKEFFPGGVAVEESAGRELETQDMLDKMTRHLPPVRKKVILLKARQGMSNKEIAEVLSISVKTVENHITKANQHMRLVSSDLLLIVLFLSYVNKM
jgi:RNA polymerase sigma factor (sigma-70 family)